MFGVSILSYGILLICTVHLLEMFDSISSWICYIQALTLLPVGRTYSDSVFDDHSCFLFVDGLYFLDLMFFTFQHIPCTTQNHFNIS